MTDPDSRSAEKADERSGRIAKGNRTNGQRLEKKSDDRSDFLVQGKVRGYVTKRGRTWYAYYRRAREKRAQQIGHNQKRGTAENRVMSAFLFNW